MSRKSRVLVLPARGRDPGENWLDSRSKIALLAWLLVCLSSQAYAQNPAGGVYPSRAVRMVTAFVPGGTGDMVARAVAKRLSDAWGQPVVVDPRPGAGMVIATDLVAKAPPDGYTLLMVSASFSVNPSLHSKLPFDSIRDLTPITLTASIPYVLVAHPSVPVRTLQELVVYAKARPGALNYGAAGTQNQLALELLKLRTGIDMVHVAYRGAPLVITDVAGGQIQIALGSTLMVAPHVNSGRLRSLAVTSARRVSSLPDLPTIAESGVPGFDVSAWNGVFVPAGVQAPVIRRLNADIVAAVRMPELRAKLAAEGGDVVGNSPDEFARFIRDEIAIWAKVVKAAGVRTE